MAMIAINETEIAVPSGFEVLPRDIVITPKRSTITVPAYATKSISLRIQIPLKNEYKSKKYVTAIEASVSSAAVLTSYRSKVYIETAP